MSEQPQESFQPAAVGVDVEREHSFDGITEFDNKLPNWWLWSFYGACIFSVFYWLSYHTFGFTPLPQEEYRQELAAARAAEEAMFTLDEVTDEGLEGLLENDRMLTRGERLFQQHCAACHRADGGGVVGPNLTDSHWLHGGHPTEIYASITKGWPTKGMIAWEPKLGAPACQQLAAFVLTMRNKNVEGGKDPEGTEFVQDN